MSDPDWFSGGFEHLGAFMRQNPKVLEVFPEFFARHRFDVVVELGRRPGLALEARAGFGVGDEVRREELQCDRPPEPGVLAPQHDAHTAAAELAGHAVPPQLGRRGGLFGASSHGNGVGETVGNAPTSGRAGPVSNRRGLPAPGRFPTVRAETSESRMAAKLRPAGERSRLR